jgi:hypothetical protein
MIKEISDDFLLSDFGSSVTAGAVVGLGIMDRHAQMLSGDDIISVEYALTVRTDLFGGLRYGDQVQHEGQSYVVRHEPMKLADGRFCVMVLERIEAIATYITTLAGLRLKTLNDKQLVTL